AKLAHSIEELRTISNVYGQYLVSTDESIESIYVMQVANPAEKSVPIRRLIIISITLISLFTSFVAAILIDMVIKR
ncbi:MAG: hypothetical protein IIA45_12650, partial [Bacteroidetes bacterium]|nr:hypothetical protein [Bacteroidota bacterium]